MDVNSLSFARSSRPERRKSKLFVRDGARTTVRFCTEYVGPPNRAQNSNQCTQTTCSPNLKNGRCKTQKTPRSTHFRSLAVETAEQNSSRVSRAAALLFCCSSVLFCCPAALRSQLRPAPRACYNAPMPTILDKIVTAKRAAIER